jgi:hypothetical protein
MGTLCDDQYTFLTISHTVLLRMRNVSDKSCRENQNMYFTFSNFFFLSKATNRLSMLFQYNSGCMIMPQYYIVCTWPVFFCMDLLFLVYPEDEGSKNPWNLGTFVPFHMVSFLKSLDSSRCTHVRSTCFCIIRISSPIGIFFPSNTKLNRIRSHFELVNRHNGKIWVYKDGRRILS